jgi:hypothetical protein
VFGVVVIVGVVAFVVLRKDRVPEDLAASASVTAGTSAGPPASAEIGEGERESAGVEEGLTDAGADPDAEDTDSGAPAPSSTAAATAAPTGARPPSTGNPQRPPATQKKKKKGGSIDFGY